MLLPSALLNPQVSKRFSLLPNNTALSLTLNPCKFSPPKSLKFPSKLRTFPPSYQSSHYVQDDDDEEDHVIGDCVVFEEGAFEDPYLQENVEPSGFDANRAKPKKGGAEIEPENLVPNKWREVQAEISMTKKERRKIAQELQFGTRIEKKRKGLVPLRNVNLEEYSAFREAKLAQLKPLVLDIASSSTEMIEEKDCKELKGNESNGSSSARVAPKNPKWAVYGKGLDDVTEFFNSGNYDPADKKREGN